MSTDADVLEARAQVARGGRRGRRAKYAAVPTVVEGVRFHSKREARRYRELRWLERAGAIVGLELQPAFPLHAVNLETGEVSQVGHYLADFRYRLKATGEVVVEDVKGMATLPLARWKQRHCHGEYGVQVEEVR